MTTLRDPEFQTGLKIDTRGRLMSYANTETIDSFHAHVGAAYNLHTQSITFTNATTTPVAYIKNNESGDLVITALFYFMGTSNNPGDSLWTVIRNPTTGTIITSTPTDFPIQQNRNFGSSNTLTIDAYIGATGDTLTDGDNFLQTALTGTGRFALTVGAIVLQKGNSIGFEYTPPASNTSQVVALAISCHLETAEPPTR